MAGRKVVLQMGLLPIPVRLEKATEEEDRNTKTVCTGTEDKPHAPAKVSSNYACTAQGCTRTASSWHPFERGVPQADGSFVVIDAKALAEAEEPIKAEMRLDFRYRDKVFGTTVAGKTVNNVIPDKGGDRGYTALVRALRERPDRVGVAVWAHTSKNHLWVIELVDNRLVASQRSWPEEVRPAPLIREAEVSDQELGFVLGMIDACEPDFDPMAYRDMARERRAALIAAASGEGGQAPPPPKRTEASGDILAQLAAQLPSTPEPVSVQGDRKVEAVPSRKAPARKRTVKKATRKPAPKGDAA